MNDNEKLKPCPFCGKEAYLYQEEVTNNISSIKCRIRCNTEDCGVRYFGENGYFTAYVDEEKYIKDVVKEWNTRKGKGVIANFVRKIKRAFQISGW